jgi:hypothetical protein
MLMTSLLEDLVSGQDVGPTPDLASHFRLDLGRLFWLVTDGTLVLGYRQIPWFTNP